jgi:hypothetical protein
MSGERCLLCKSINMSSRARRAFSSDRRREKCSPVVRQNVTVLIESDIYIESKMYKKQLEWGRVDNDR